MLTGLVVRNWSLITGRVCGCVWGGGGGGLKMPKSRVRNFLGPLS